MTEIRFYHLLRQSVEQALPPLLQKALSTGKRIVVKAPSASLVAQLNDYLWAHNPDSFIPHGSAEDGHADLQPIYLTDQDENPNGADILILTFGASTQSQKDFDLCCELFDGNNEDALQTARARWKDYKDQDFDLTYWQQTEKGWEKKQ